MKWMLARFDTHKGAQTPIRIREYCFWLFVCYLSPRRNLNYHKHLNASNFFIIKNNIIYEVSNRLQNY